MTPRGATRLVRPSGLAAARTLVRLTEDAAAPAGSCAASARAGSPGEARTGAGRADTGRRNGAAVAAGAAAAAGAVALGLGGPAAVTVWGVVAAAGSVLVRGRARRRGDEATRKLVLAHLPVVTERLVLAVRAGLDVVPAMEAAAAGEGPEESSAPGTARVDPVTELLREVTAKIRAGAAPDAALRETASGHPSAAVRHTFLHLARSYREGGGLAAPLEELGDATLRYYEEATDEEIATLPMKAVFPLLLTFAGLLLLFTAGPVTKVIGLTARQVLK